jgi:hypothetical protein
MRHGAYGATVYALILLGALTAAASPAPSGPSVPFVTIARGTTSRVHAPIHLVIHDARTWSHLWTQILNPRQGAPVVDFTRDMAIAIASGPVPERTTLTITRITRLSGRLLVWYTLSPTRPDGAGGSTSAPFHVVRVARSPLPVQFVLLKTPPILSRPTAPAE